MADDTTNTGAPANAGAAPQTADTTATTTTTAPAQDGQSVVASAPAPEATSTTTEATAPASKPAAPEAYDLKLPEGSLLSADAVQEVEALAREAGLSNEHAQKLLDDRESALAAHVEKVQAEHDHRWKQEWPEAIKNDPEMGGEKYEATVRNAQKVMAKFASPALKEALTASGYGNHPEMVRMMSSIAKVISEDTFEPAGGQAAGTKQGGAGWYNHPTSQHAA
ncbi:MAG TPA: hypothetical protein PLN35_19130 [Quisquiliibacterium sp.]|nr:hypothetical protein [Quisquiliibacterium sp.]